MPKLSNEEKKAKIIALDEKNLEKFKNKLSKCPFLYVSEFDDGSNYRSEGKFNLLTGKFDLKKFKTYDVAEDAELTNSTTTFFYPDGSIVTFEFSKNSNEKDNYDFIDLEENPKLINEKSTDILTTLNKMELSLVMSKEMTVDQDSNTSKGFKL